MLVVGLAAVATALAVWAYRSRGGEEVVLVAGAVVGELAAFAVALGADDAHPGRRGAVHGRGRRPRVRVPARAGLAVVGGRRRRAGRFLALAARPRGRRSWRRSRSRSPRSACSPARSAGARRRGLSSWAVAGPAITAGLVPSALASVGDEGLLRPLLLLAVASVLLVVGVQRRWQALVVVPAVAVAVVAVSQLAPWAVGLPRWSSLGAAGVLLLAVGIRYESRRRNVLAAARWVRSLG